jgi:hypothetical protein
MVYTQSSVLYEEYLEAKGDLKEYLTNYTCEPYNEGSFNDRTEFSITNGKLSIWTNYSLKDQELWGYPEYGKFIIDLTEIRKIEPEDNDAPCIGLNIKCFSEGIRLLRKMPNQNETNWPNEKELLEKHGFKCDLIRLKRNDDAALTLSRINKVISAIKIISIYNGNSHLKI